MVVLTLQPNEGVSISDNIVVTVLSIQGDEVRLGIEVPGEMPVHRREMHQAIENQEISMAFGQYRGAI